MPKIKWDQVGDRLYETGVDHGVLYLPDNTGKYTQGVAWNGLTSVSESPSGAEPNKQYADNIVYLNLISAEEYAATIEAFTYPDEFGECNGEKAPAPGIAVGQQNRRTFGFSWRTIIGNDVLGQDYGYKIHLVWGALAAPSEKAYNTINDSPEAITFSWEISTTAIGVDIEGYKPVASLTIDSTQVDKTALAALEVLLYGADGGSSAAVASLPSPQEVIELFADTVGAP